MTPLRRGLSLAGPWLYLPAMPMLPMPSAAADREHEAARWHPERETLELATAGAAQVLGPDHGVCRANSNYVYKLPLFHRLVNPGGSGTIGAHA